MWYAYCISFEKCWAFRIFINRNIMRCWSFCWVPNDAGICAQEVCVRTKRLKCFCCCFVFFLLMLTKHNLGCRLKCKHGISHPLRNVGLHAWYVCTLLFQGNKFSSLNAIFAFWYCMSWNTHTWRGASSCLVLVFQFIYFFAPVYFFLHWK